MLSGMAASSAGGLPDGVCARTSSRWPEVSWLILDYTMDYRVLGYLIAISIGTGLLFGLAPAIRLSKLDVNAALKDGGRGATGGGRGTASVRPPGGRRNGARHRAACGSGSDDPQLS